MSFDFRTTARTPAPLSKTGTALELTSTSWCSPGRQDPRHLCFHRDTSAAAALYSAYREKPDRLRGDPAARKGHAAAAFAAPGQRREGLEVPGVFDDCMKVVEAAIRQRRPVTSKTLADPGSGVYSYEIAQNFEYDLAGKMVVVPIGNAGNITAVMQGFFVSMTGIIETLPRVIGVQPLVISDPVFRYYLEPDAARRRFVPVTVEPPWPRPP